MLTIYRRHIQTCSHRSEGRKYRRCQCPIWADGFLDGQQIRKALRDTDRRNSVRDWQKAQDMVREWEAENKITQGPKAGPLAIKECSEKTIADAQARHLRSPSLYKHRLLFRQLQDFADQRGFRYRNEFGLDQWREFGATWPNKNISALKKLGYLRTFLRFCHDNGWFPENYGHKLGSPRIIQRPTMPFTQDEMVKILAASKPGSRVRPLVLLLRYRGLRIHYAVTLERERVSHGKLLLYTHKTNAPVYFPLPGFVVNALEAILPRSDYGFWTGHGKPKSVTSYWQRRLQELFKGAGVPGGHAHRFRDTFAVKLLLAEISIEGVAALLGHTSVKTTERHYAPWTHSRQAQLESDVRKAWVEDPVVFAETKGTPYVQEKRLYLN